ncbi:MAG: WbqC family protein [Rhodoferax sp.]|jgi:hypothetical protein|nr:WbqC family protein [Rhodoferax sp.]
MKLAIMQPYFLPYIGYFQLMSAVDVFVVYDNIKYTKKGWINRNRILQNGHDVMFSLPLKADSDQRDIDQRQLADTFRPDDLVNQISGAYRQAPYFQQTMPLMTSICRHHDHNLFAFLHHALVLTAAHLGIGTRIVKSSDVQADHTLKGQDRVLAICKALGADRYFNSIGGQALYARDAFQNRGVELLFVQAKPLEYPQFGQAFVPWLSILDVLMFNPLDHVRTAVSTHYELI